MGIMQINANPASPIDKNSYIENRNNSKSNITLPLFSWANSDILFE